MAGSKLGRIPTHQPFRDLEFARAAGRTGGHARAAKLRATRGPVSVYA